jgi:hypothetical protein
MTSFCRIPEWITKIPREIKGKLGNLCSISCQREAHILSCIAIANILGVSLTDILIQISALLSEDAKTAKILLPLDPINIKSSLDYTGEDTELYNEENYYKHIIDQTEEEIVNHENAIKGLKMEIIELGKKMESEKIRNNPSRNTDNANMKVLINQMGDHEAEIVQLQKQIQIINNEKTGIYKILERLGVNNATLDTKSSFDIIKNLLLKISKKGLRGLRDSIPIYNELYAQMYKFVVARRLSNGYDDCPPIGGNRTRRYRKPKTRRRKQSKRRANKRTNRRRNP